MKHFDHITLNWSIGLFHSQFQEAQDIARKTGCKVTFVFNGVNVDVTKDSDYTPTWDKYHKDLHKGVE